jgi:hypothetical protein
VSLGGLVLRFSGDGIQVLDAKSELKIAATRLLPSHRLFVLTVAKIDVHDSHRFQCLPSLLGGEVVASRLEFFLQRAVQ